MYIPKAIVTTILTNEIHLLNPLTALKYIQGLLSPANKAGTVLWKSPYSLLVCVKKKKKNCGTNYLHF